MTSTNRKTTVFIWVLAVVMTLLSAFYQRTTGPTYPVRGGLEIDDQQVKYCLLRSHISSSDAEIKIVAPESSIGGYYEFRRYKSHDQWSRVPLKREAESLLATLPKQPPAGKVMYQITLTDSAGNQYDLTGEPVIMRFKGEVPVSVIIPHIILIFSAMLFSTRTGFEAIFNRPRQYSYTVATVILMLVGGMILGPVVQKYAFGAFWTGWPFGHDLTDNKTLVAFIFWVIALARARIKGKGRGWILAASVVTLLVFLIPHSVLGSELDYTEIE